jgi:hypothetical protein
MSLMSTLFYQLSTNIVIASTDLLSHFYRRIDYDRSNNEPAHGLKRGPINFLCDRHLTLRMGAERC